MCFRYSGVHLTKCETKVHVCVCVGSEMVLPPNAVANLDLNSV